MFDDRNAFFDYEDSRTAKTLPRRANETFSALEGPELPMLFDAFWQPAEVALLFGAPGVGKSMLAVQIAEALARGQSVIGRGSSGIAPQSILYVDLVLSRLQFALRYAGYQFASEFYRDTPPFNVDLLDWLSEMVENYKFDCIVIDDLSMIDDTSDGVRRSLELMHHLRLLARAFSTSVLVLADSYPLVFERFPERSLRRSQILCSVADSTFALTVPPDAGRGRRDLIQTRSRSDELIWTAASPLPCFLERLPNGLTGFRFDPPEIDKELTEKIAVIRQMHDQQGKTFRAIAAELNISKSQAQRLHSL